MDSSKGNQSRPRPSKGRKPPKFVHLHPKQAIKAKQAWVQKVKLRSEWAKQKRQLGLGGGGVGASREDEEETEENIRASPGDDEKYKGSLKRRNDVVYGQEDSMDLRPDRRTPKSPFIPSNPILYVEKDHEMIQQAIRTRNSLEARGRKVVGSLI